ncbi:MAG: hypothetical protein Q9195_008843 [Heterodermia aff. obscurata]
MNLSLAAINLPILTPASAGEDTVAMTSGQWAKLPLDIGILQRAQLQLSSASRKSISLSAATEIIWAILLRTYTGSDRIVFGRIDDDAIGPENVSYSFTDESCSKPIVELVEFRTTTAFAANDVQSMLWLSHNAAEESKARLFGMGDVALGVQVSHDSVHVLARDDMCYWHSVASPEHAANLRHTLQHLAETISCNPLSCINDLDRISRKDFFSIQRWNSRTSFPSFISLPDMLLRQAEQRPDAQAMHAWDGKWTYRQLYEAAKDLASCLKEMNAQQGDNIVFRVEKSGWAVAGMVAVLIVGAVCVPVDVRYPVKRVKQIIEATKPKLLLVTKRIESTVLEQYQDVNQFIIPPITSPRPSVVRLQDIRPPQAAFIFFTSGSTGAPKGVVQEHFALSVKVQQIAAALNQDAGSRTLQYSSFTFDPCVGDIFGTFHTGGCLLVPSEQQRLDDLAGVVTQMQCTHLCVTATTLSTLAPDKVSCLHRVTVGGEPMTREQIREWSAHVHLSVIYGTTESVIWDTIQDCIVQEDSPSNVGRSLGPSTWIVDTVDTSKILPIGAVGELLIGGCSLARGYLSEPTLTNSCFIDCSPQLQSFSAERLYRTGDLAQYRPDGSIQLLGRKDQQVKINGQRVELGEIEYALRRSLPKKVASAVDVVYAGDQGRQPTLCAFVGGLEADLREIVLSDLQDSMVQTVPEYMIPVSLVKVGAKLPTTSSGKTDRVRLREIGGRSLQAQRYDHEHSININGDTNTAPESKLLSLWIEVLKVKGIRFVDLQDDFFKLGGDSVAAIKLVALARKHGLFFSVSDLFEQRTLSSLAATAKTSSDTAAAKAVVPFSLLESTEPHEDLIEDMAKACHVPVDKIQDILPRTPIQEGLFALTHKSGGDYLAQIILELPHHVDKEKFQAAYDHVAAQNSILRTRFAHRRIGDAQLHQVILNEEPEWRFYSSLDECKAHNSQQLTCEIGEPLIRCNLVSSRDGKHYFLWAIHHALYDEWSFQLMLDSIERRYHGESIMELIPLKYFLRHLKIEIDQDACRSFWQSELKDARSFDFPSGLPSSYQPTGATRIMGHIVEDIAWPMTGFTPSTVMRAAWALLLSRYSSNHDVVFGVTVNGRQIELPGIERIAGPTFATIPLRVQLGDLLQRPVSDLLARIQQQATTTIPFEQYGLQSISRVSDDAEQACRFQTLLVIGTEGWAKKESRILKPIDQHSWDTMNTYAITLEVTLLERQVQFQLRYDETALDDAQAERLLQQLEHVTRELVKCSTADRLVSEVDCVASRDKEILRTWNRLSPFPDHHPVTQQIAWRSRNQPGTIAIETDGETLSYRCLNLYIEHLAKKLKCEHGLHKGQRVLICSEKSLWCVLGFFGVLKAGGVCILLDFNIPPRRLDAIRNLSMPVLALRIELAEIEHHVRKLVGLHESVVADILETGQNSKANVCALISDAHGNEEVSRLSSQRTDELQYQLKEFLPSYMIPSIFLAVKRLPKTSTGKVDRKALRALQIPASQVASEAVTSNPVRKSRKMTATEHTLCQLWQETLRLPQDHVDLDDDFFKLGGNSIDAMRLTASARREGFSLTVKIIMTRPKLWQQALEMAEFGDDDDHPIIPFSLLGRNIQVDELREAAAVKCNVHSQHIEDIFPCTPMQIALLALTSKRAGDYVSREVYDFSADAGQFERAWQIVAAETPILRTRIIDLGFEGLSQVIVDERLAWEYFDGSLENYLKYNETILMELGKPLTRCALVRDPERSGHGLFVWTIHHALHDGWSFRLILDQVDLAYQNQVLKRTRPYQHFIKYVNTHATSARADEFWKRSLDGAAPTAFIALPSAQYEVRAKAHSHRHTRSAVSNHQLGATPTSIIRVAWALLLAHYVGNDDVIFGVIVLGRQVPLKDIETVVAPTIANVPIRVCLRHQDTVSELLDSVRHQAAEMIPFEQIGLHRIRRLSKEIERATNFETVVVIQPEDKHLGSALPHSLFQHRIADKAFGDFNNNALMLRCVLQKDGVELHLQYDDALIKTEQANRILSQLEHVISQLCNSSPTTVISDIDLISPSDLAEIWQWNGKALDPIDTTIETLFRQRLCQSPDARAVDAWDGQLTYQELDRCSNRLARELTARGLKRRDHIALCFKKSMWAVVAIFAAIIAGGTLVMIESSQPEHRLQIIMSQVDASMMIASRDLEDLAHRLLPGRAVITVSEDIDIMRPVLNDSPELRSEQPVVNLPQDALYIVFTSGTTGKPKGVIVTHRNFCSFMHHRSSVLPYTSDDRILDGASWSFDLSWANVLYTLCSGACLCIPQHSKDIAGAIATFRPTVMGIAPSAARHLDPDISKSLRTLVFGGEQPRKMDHARWANEKIDVFNSYGPAECTVSVALASLSEASSVNIGRGLSSGFDIVVEVIILPTTASQLLVAFVSENANQTAPKIDQTTVGMRYLEHVVGQKLLQSLPQHMCPSTYILMESIPRLVSGKIDRQKLRDFATHEIEDNRSGSGSTKDSSSKRRPSTSNEIDLQRLWAKTLNIAVDSIGADDQFFQFLGGDSINAMRLVGLAREFGISFTVSDVYMHPKLCDLAQVTKTTSSAGPDSSFPFQFYPDGTDLNDLKQAASIRCSVIVSQVRDIIPCTPLQEGLLASTDKNPESYTTTEVFSLREKIDLDRLLAAWATVVQDIPVLHTRIVDLPNEGLRQVHIEAPFSWTTSDNLQVAVERHGFEPGLGKPLTQWTVVTEANGQKHLVWAVHHALFDGWSIPLILRQVERAYHQERPQLLRSMQPFVHYLQSVSTASSLEFWSQLLRDCAAPSFPPVPSMSYVSNTTGSITTDLPIRKWPRHTNVTPSAWILAAWALLIGRLHAIDDVTFGTVTSGRQVPVVGISEIVGPTIATIPFRVTLDWSQPFDQFAENLQKQGAKQIPFEHVGIQNLKRINTDTERACSFQTLLNIQHGVSIPSSRLWVHRESTASANFAHYPWILDVCLDEKNTSVRADFDENVVSRREAERLISQFKMILSSISQDTSAPLNTINLISQNELKEIWGWNRLVPSTRSALLQDIIARQASRRSSAQAVDAWDGSWTYQELEDVTSRLAAHLQVQYRVGVSVLGANFPLLSNANFEFSYSQEF